MFEGEGFTSFNRCGPQCIRRKSVFNAFALSAKKNKSRVLLEGNPRTSILSKPKNNPFIPEIQKIGTEMHLYFPLFEIESNLNYFSWNHLIYRKTPYV